MYEHIDCGAANRVGDIRKTVNPRLVDIAKEDVSPDGEQGTHIVWLCDVPKEAAKEFSMMFRRWETLRELKHESWSEMQSLYDSLAQYILTTRD